MTTINPNSGGFFTGGPSGSTPGVDTQDLYVVSGVVSGENLVLTLSNQTTVTITLESVFTNGELTGLNYNETSGVLTVNQGSRSFSTTIDVSGDALSTATIVYDAPTSTLIFTETDGDTVETFTVPFPTIIEDVYDADGNQLVVTTVGGRTRVTLPEYLTQDSLDTQLLGKEDKIDALLVDFVSSTEAHLALYSEDDEGNATRTDNDEPLKIKASGNLTVVSTEEHKTNGLYHDFIIDGSLKQDKIDAVLADATEQQAEDGVVEIGLFRNVGDEAASDNVQPIVLKGIGGIAINVGTEHGETGFHSEIEIDGSAIVVEGGGGGFTSSENQFPTGVLDTAVFEQVVEIDGEEVSFFIRGTRQGTTPFAAGSSLNVNNSSVFSTLPSNIVLSVSAVSGTLTGITSSSPAGGTIAQGSVSWPSVNYNAGGNHTFTAETEGTDSDGEGGSSTTSSSFRRYVPEYVMNTQPSAFADFTGEREPSTSLTGTNPMGSTFLVTTVDYGAVKTVQVMGFSLDAPRVATGIVSHADIAGSTHSYSVYRFAIDQGTGVTL